MYIKPINNSTLFARDLYIREGLVELVVYTINIVLNFSSLCIRNVVSVYCCKVGRNAA